MRTSAKSPMNQPLLTGINPVTGKVWQQGEMDDVARNHDGVAKGWVSEALSVCVANRAGDVLFTMAPFRYVGVKNALVFDDKPDSAYTNENSSENRAQGYMPDVLRRAMLHASASVHFPASFADYDRTDRDVATMKLMASRFECAPALITSTADDPERLRRMKEFGRLHGNTMRFERPRDWRV